ncbi:MAG TPA: chloride channel protein [Solirubrobacteraceae bacterium]|nr:chloride channel protein [Solirubrobacteraceae bacterium]
MTAPSPRRWSSHQPNVPGRGIVAGYTARFWGLVVGLGVVTGAAASALMALLRLTERLAFGSGHGSFLTDVRASADLRRVVVLVLAGLIVAAASRIRRRGPLAGGTEVSEALWLHGGRLRLPPSLERGVISIVTVGMGVSLGREAAPQLAGAAAASRLSDWADLPLWQRRLLVAAGAGAGFGAVYNVPLGGALFALEVLLGTLALPLVVPALAVSVIATAVAWITLGTAHTYVMPSYGVHAAQLAWAALAGPLLGLLAVGWVRLIARAAAARPSGRLALVVPPVVMLGLGLLSIPYPELLGNGKGIVQLAVAGGLSLGVGAALMVLKPAVTAACLASGAPGGLFTPTLTVGVLVSVVLAALWSHLWPHVAPGAYALIGGGAFLAAAMQGPISGIVIVLELTQRFDALMVPTLLAVCLATIVARRLGAHTIYSARLPRSPFPGSEAIGTLDDDRASLPPPPQNDERAGRDAPDPPSTSAGVPG